ncbi:MAG: hypothetical protein CMJ90_07305 [Planctomycetes bacterium]|nr:hypothetical protein [Planctomycetota bacterium]
MRLPRGIFVKLVTIFLVIGLIPFLVLSWWTYSKARDRMTETVIKYWLVRQARETAAQLDREVSGMRTLIRSRADDNILASQMADLLGQGAAQWGGLEAHLNEFLRRQKNYRHDLDLLLLIEASGRTIVAESTTGEKHLRGSKIDDLKLSESERTWLDHALSPSAAALNQPEVPVSTNDWHVSTLSTLAAGEPPYEMEKSGYPDKANRYAIGFAGTIVAPGGTQPVGALIGLFNWSSIQGVLDQVTERFKSPDQPGSSGTRYESGYPFLFASDRDTIIAHNKQDLLGNSLKRDHGLGGLHEAMGTAPYGAHEYEYPPGTTKISGFAYTNDSEHGFAWVVGVGINHTEIYGDVYLLRDFMVIAALIVTGMVILMAAVFSHRLTEPITRLIGYTQELARGNLKARVAIKTNDEIAVLADSFNKMAEDLGESNRRLIKAEKDAAWQEMARQVAHEIKNPLTPIMLSAQQLRTAHQDRHPAFDDILSDSVKTIVDQCEGLRRIASDFASFGRFPNREVESHDIAELVSNAVHMYRGRDEADVLVTCEIKTPEGTEVLVDKDEIGRVFLNLFNNAMEAMDDDGQIYVEARSDDGERGRVVEIQVTDTGRGIPEADRARLFEPYFSTRTGGTGLGLAICQRIILEYGGNIDVVSAIDEGTTFTITLPEAQKGKQED